MSAESELGKWRADVRVAKATHDALARQIDNYIDLPDGSIGYTLVIEAVTHYRDALVKLWQLYARAPDGAFEKGTKGLILEHLERQIQEYDEFLTES